MAEAKRRFQPLKLFRGSFEWTIYTEDGSEVAFEVYDEAYAHLFAAAPDLYEACEAAYRYLNRFMTHTREQAQVFALVREALRKARGDDR